MAPYLMRSAVAIGRRANPQVSASLRRSSPRSFASGGALRVEATKGCCMDGVHMKDLETISANLREVNERAQFLLEHERRKQRSEQRQKKLACALVPSTIALYIFGPEKKGKPSPEGQSGI